MDKKIINSLISRMNDWINREFSYDKENNDLKKLQQCKIAEQVFKQFINNYTENKLKNCIVSDENFYKGILQVGDLVEVVDEDNNLKEIIELNKFDIDDLQKTTFPILYGKNYNEYTIDEINRIFVKQTIQGQRTAYVEVWNKEKGVI